MLETSVLPAPELLTDIPHAPDPLHAHRWRYSWGWASRSRGQPPAQADL